MNTLKVIFNGVVVNNDTIDIQYTDGLTIYGTILSGTTGSPSTNQFAVSTISAVDQASKFKTGFDALGNSDFITTLDTTTVTNDTVLITTVNLSIDMFYGFSSSLNVEFDLIDIDITDIILNNVQDLRVRSSHLIVSSGVTPTEFTLTNFTIKQFEGPISGSTIAPISYSKDKAKIVPSQTNIYVNISNLIREDLECNINYFQDTDFITARNLSPLESKWVDVKTTNYYLGTGTTMNEKIYFVTDGYIEPFEEQGLPNILMTGDKRYIYRGSDARVYFKTLNLTGATYNTPSTTGTTISYSGDLDSNQGYVKSVKVNIPLDDNKITYNFNYEGGINHSVTFFIYDECKYENYDLVFKNKYGVLESLSMSKKSMNTLNVEATDYLRSIVDFNGDFNINRHTQKQYNVSGNEEITLNTTFLPEYMNAPIKEAMLTEEMWLIDSLGNIIPVIRMDQNIQFKTGLNDKLIQYTIRVKRSHKTIKNII